MTDEELAAIETHAQAVDSPMSENCLRLIEYLKTCRVAKALVTRRLEVAVRERDEVRQDFTDCNEDRERACEFERRFEADCNRLKIRLEAVTENRDLMQEERDELREALKRYGHHELGPDGCRYEGPGFGGPPCTCGLAGLMENHRCPE